MPPTDSVPIPSFSMSACRSSWAPAPTSYESAMTGSTDSGPSSARHSIESWAGRASRAALIVTDSNLAALGLPSAYESALSDAGHRRP